MGHVVIVLISFIIGFVRGTEYEETIVVNSEDIADFIVDYVRRRSRNNG